MDFKKLSGILVGLGLLLIAGALIWWMAFYGKVVEKTNSSLSEAIPCIFQYGGECGMVSAIASLVGYTPYSPTPFWAGVILFGAGIILRFSLKRK